MDSKMETYSRHSTNSTMWENVVNFLNFNEKFCVSTNSNKSREAGLIGFLEKSDCEFAFLLYPQIIHQDGHRSLGLQMEYKPSGKYGNKIGAYIELKITGNKSNIYEVKLSASIRAGQAFVWDDFIYHDDVVKHFNSVCSLHMEVKIQIFHGSEINENFEKLEPLLKYSLTTRQKRLCEDLQNAQTDAYECTLVGNGFQIRIPKLTLAVCSPVFEAMFRTPMLEMSTNRVELKKNDFGESESFETVTSLVKYLNTGECTRKDATLELLLFAHKYQMDPLTDICIESLCKNIENEQICSIFHWAHFLDIPSIKEACVRAFRGNVRLIYETPEFKKWSETEHHMLHELSSVYTRKKLRPFDIHLIKKRQLIPKGLRKSMSFADEKIFFDVRHESTPFPAIPPDNRSQMSNETNISSLKATVIHDCTVQHLFKHPDYFWVFKSSDFCSPDDQQLIRARLLVQPYGREPDYNDPEKKDVILSLEVHASEKFGLIHTMDVEMRVGTMTPAKPTKSLKHSSTLFVWEFPRKQWNANPGTDNEYNVHVEITVSTDRVAKVFEEQNWPLLAKSMESLVKSGRGGDIILMFGEHRFLAHKHVLAARSEWIAGILANARDDLNGFCIYTHHCAKCEKAVRDLMVYAYTGRYPKRENMNSCLKNLASLFDMDHLASDCKGNKGARCKPGLHQIWWSPEMFELVAKKVVNFPEPAKPVEDPDDPAVIMARRHPKTHGPPSVSRALPHYRSLIL